MAEYVNVEKPFLDKLRQLGWTVIDQGLGIPQEPGESLRENFKQVLLPKVFKESIKAINETDDGREWLTDKQLNEILFEIQNFAGKGLHEANKEIQRLLLKGTSVSKNELTGEHDPTVWLLDFKNYDSNSFVAINQFRLLTPGASREGIIPDIVLFLNGLPVVVVEAKDFDVAEPLVKGICKLHVTPTPVMMITDLRKARKNYSTTIRMGRKGINKTSKYKNKCNITKNKVIIAVHIPI